MGKESKTNVLLVSSELGSGVKRFFEHNTKLNLSLNSWADKLKEKGQKYTYYGRDSYTLTNEEHDFTVELIEFKDIDLAFVSLIRELVQDENEKAHCDFFVLN